MLVLICHYLLLVLIHSYFVASGRLCFVICLTKFVLLDSLHISHIVGNDPFNICEKQRFRRACASAQTRQNLCCLLTKAVIQVKTAAKELDICSLANGPGMRTRGLFDGMSEKLFVSRSGSCIFFSVETTSRKSVLLCNATYHTTEINYSRLSLSRIPRDSLKYFEISVHRHIRFA